ncbi:MAG: hypothetical protein ABTR07_14780 [Candidatus Competibacter denitrificans]
MNQALDLLSGLPCWPFTLISGLLGILGGFAIQRFLWRLKAAQKFRATFTADLMALRHLAVDDYGQVYDLLKAAYPRHEAAYLDYRHHLGRIGRWRLQRRWLAYRGPYPKPPEIPEEDHRYQLMHWIGTSLEEERKIREAAIKAISQLTR